VGLVVIILRNLGLLECTKCIIAIRHKKDLDCIILLDIPWEMLFPGNKVGGRGPAAKTLVVSSKLF